MDILQYDIIITRHAFLKAFERGIRPDMIEASIKGGTIERFAKHNIRFMKQYKDFSVICVGEIKGMQIKILTVERGKL